MKVLFDSKIKLATIEVMTEQEAVNFTDFFPTFCDAPVSYVKDLFEDNVYFIQIEYKGYTQKAIKDAVKLTNGDF